MDWLESAQLECECSNVAAEVGIGPKCYKSWICVDESTTLYHYSPGDTILSATLYDYVPGEDFYSHSFRAERDSSKLFDQFLIFLKYLRQFHKKKLYHGDIHGKNMILRGDGVIMLVDFGKCNKIKRVVITGRRQTCKNFCMDKTSRVEYYSN